MDSTELIRGVLGVLALLVAGAQLTMRWAVAHDLAHTQPKAKMKERTMSVALLFLLAGIGVGNLTHLHQDPSVSTLLISMGILVAGLGLIDIFRWGQEESNGSTSDQ